MRMWLFRTMRPLNDFTEGRMNIMERDCDKFTPFSGEGTSVNQKMVHLIVKARGALEWIVFIFSKASWPRITERPTLMKDWNNKSQYLWNCFHLGFIVSRGSWNLRIRGEFFSKTEFYWTHSAPKKRNWVGLDSLEYQKNRKKLGAFKFFVEIDENTMIILDWSMQAK